MVLDIDQFRVEKGGNPDKIRYIPVTEYEITVHLSLNPF
jgi:hypothetical protein